MPFTQFLLLTREERSGSCLITLTLIGLFITLLLLSGFLLSVATVALSVTDTFPTGADLSGGEDKNKGKDDEPDTFSVLFLHFDWYPFITNVPNLLI